MDQNNREPRQYRGTKGLSLAIVIGVAVGTVIGKLMNNMNTGLMLGLVIGVVGWTLTAGRPRRRRSLPPQRNKTRLPQRKRRTARTHGSRNKPPCILNDSQVPRRKIRRICEVFSIDISALMRYSVLTIQKKAQDRKMKASLFTAYYYYFTVSER